MIWGDYGYPTRHVAVKMATIFCFAFFTISATDASRPIFVIKLSDAVQPNQINGIQIISYDGVLVLDGAGKLKPVPEIKIAAKAEALLAIRYKEKNSSAKRYYQVKIKFRPSYRSMGGGNPILIIERESHENCPYSLVSRFWPQEKEEIFINNFKKAENSDKLNDFLRLQSLIWSGCNPRIYDRLTRISEIIAPKQTLEIVF